MAEEVVYRVRFEGASEMASQINGLENRLEHLKSVIQNAFTFTPRISGPATRREKSFWELPGLSKYRARLYDIFDWKQVRNDRRWTALPFLPSFGDAGRDMASAFRAAHRLHDEYARMFGRGTGDFRRGSMLFGGGGGSGGAFSGGLGRGFAQRLLGFSSNVNPYVFYRNQDDNSINAESWWSGGDEAARTQRTRRNRDTHTYRRRYHNPFWNDPFDFFVNRRPYRRGSWTDRMYDNIQSLVPKGAARDIIGRVRGMGPFGRAMGLFVSGTLAAGAALAVLRKIVTALFVPLQAMADEVFKFYRTRHQMGGLNNGELSKMGWAGYIMGGKPEENYALMARIAGERASLLWGGDGGKYMSVARRFGVDISGSGAGGLATEREWMRAIAIRMQELDSSAKLALANEAGLSREQMWLVSNGLRYYDWASSRRTLGQMAWGGMLGEDVYTDNFQKESQNFWTDWGAFVAVFKEFIGSIGEILIPVVNLILEILIGVFGLLNLFLKPIATLIGKIFSLLNISFWTNMANMESSIPNYGKYDMGMMQTTMYQHPNANIKVGDINVTSSRADPEEVAKDVGNAVVQAALTRIYDVEAGGAERSVA